MAFLLKLQCSYFLWGPYPTPCLPVEWGKNWGEGPQNLCVGIWSCPPGWPEWELCSKGGRWEIYLPWNIRCCSPGLSERVRVPTCPLSNHAVTWGAQVSPEPSYLAAFCSLYSDCARCAWKKFPKHLTGTGVSVLGGGKCHLPSHIFTDDAESQHSERIRTCCLSYCLVLGALDFII